MRQPRAAGVLTFKDTLAPVLDLQGYPGTCLGIKAKAAGNSDSLDLQSPSHRARRRLYPFWEEIWLSAKKLVMAHSWSYSDGGGSTMKTPDLEDKIETLSALDRLRIESATLRDMGRDALRDFDNIGWERSDSPVENELAIKALCDRKKGPPEDLVRRIEMIRPRDILGGSVQVPVLWAARSMQALAAAPSLAFSEVLFVFYYQIVREIYTADAPDWHVGGARAAVGGVASAYVTGECLRALLGFVRTLENTSRFIDEAGKTLKRTEQLKRCYEGWKLTERIRLAHDFYNTVLPLQDNIAYRLNLPKLYPNPDNVDAFLEKLPEELDRAVKASVETLKNALQEIKNFREGAERIKASEASFKNIGSNVGQDFRRSTEEKQFERSATGHAVAFGAIEQAFERSKIAAKKLLPTHDKTPDLESLQELSGMFKSAARSVSRLIYPVRSFLSAVLDRELTAAASPEGRPLWDPAEMAFAAASYGFAANWDDDRLRRAGNYLAEAMSENGRFPAGMPFHVYAEGSHIEVFGADVLRAFAQILEHVDTIPVHEALVRPMLRFFNDTRTKLSEKPVLYGWCPETIQGYRRPIRWLTAIAVMALDRINEMLDARINKEVFLHFSIKRPKDLKNLNLRNIFYPDYGIAGKATFYHESVAVALQRMRGHVLGVSLREEKVESLFSTILYGPPGTGKTTLIEALAKSSDVPLIEVTPSDIISGGEEAVERRTRAVFKALSLLTGAVILFDEFDPVLRQRNPEDVGPNTVFSFVTPGMLPKLKTLHDNAKGRRVVYALVTNHIGTLDEAAIRSGRFDARIGIYPPDPLSRAGRLIEQIIEFEEDARANLLVMEEGGTGKLQKGFKKRVWKIIRKTNGVPIELLTKPGWFLRPKNAEIPKGSLFDYIRGGAEKIPTIKPEEKFEKSHSKELQSKRAMAIQDFRQSAWLLTWEEKIQKVKTVEEFEINLKSPAHKMAPPSASSISKPEAAYLVWGSEAPSGASFMRLYVKAEEENNSPPKGIEALPSAPKKVTKKSLKPKSSKKEPNT